MNISKTQDDPSNRIIPPTRAHGTSHQYQSHHHTSTYVSRLKHKVWHRSAICSFPRTQAIASKHVQGVDREASLTLSSTSSTLLLVTAANTLLRGSAADLSIHLPADTRRAGTLCCVGATSFTCFASQKTRSFLISLRATYATPHFLEATCPRRP